MAFDKETFEVNEGLKRKTYNVTDESKACEIAVLKELVQAIKSLSANLRMRR